MTLSMPPKMGERVDALEECLTTLEVSMQQCLVEFRQALMEVCQITLQRGWESFGTSNRRGPRNRIQDGCEED